MTYITSTLVRERAPGALQAKQQRQRIHAHENRTIICHTKIDLVDWLLVTQRGGLKKNSELESGICTHSDA